MEFITALINTPAPTLLIIFGFIFLFLGIATIKKPIVIDVTPPSNRKIAIILGVVLLGIGLYLLSLKIPEETPDISATATATIEISSPVTALPPSAIPITDTALPTSPTHLFEDGCINKNIWLLLQGNTALDENNCWNLDSKGIVASNGTGLTINVIGSQSSRVNGLVTEISANTDVSFDMQISKLSTINDFNTNVAVGLLPNATATPSQEGTSILFQSGLPNKPIWMMLQIPDVPQKYLPPPEIQLNKIHNVKLEIRGTRLITYLDYEKVDDRVLSNSHSYLWIGYTVAEGGTLSVTLSNFSLDRK